MPPPRRVLAARLREIVFGSQDALVSTVGAVSGIAVGTEDRQAVVVAGLVIIVVESLSMACGSYLSSKSHREYLERLLREEMESIEKDPEHERMELLEMYRERGFTDAEIGVIAKRLFADKRWLLEDMAHKELGICPGNLEEPLSNSAAMGISYLLAGLVPVLPYLFLPLAWGMPVSIAASAVSLLGLGAAKGTWVRRGRLASALEMFFIAGLACGMGFVIGRLSRGLVP